MATEEELLGSDSMVLLEVLLCRVHIDSKTNRDGQVTNEVRDCHVEREVNFFLDCSQVILVSRLVAISTNYEYETSSVSLFSLWRCHDHVITKYTFFFEEVGRSHCH